MSKRESWVKAKLPLRWVEGLQFQGQAPVQEDYFEVNPERGIFMIADGFGGSAGEAAAKLAVKSIRQFLEQEAGDLDATLPFELRPYFSLAGNVLFNAVAYANQKVMKLNQNRSSMQAGGASLLAGYLEGRLLALANVGSCSAHLFRGGRSKEIAVPKTLERQVNPFEETSPMGISVPLMSFGTAKLLEPEIIEVEMKPGDQLCFQTPGIPPLFRDQLFHLNSPENLRQIVDEEPTETQLKSNGAFIWVSF